MQLQMMISTCVLPAVGLLEKGYHLEMYPSQDQMSADLVCANQGSDVVWSYFQLFGPRSPQIVQIWSHQGLQVTKVWSKGLKTRSPLFLGC
mmetsp:Transcript_83933/g.147711  ORF Transcript_83933/g.147711 Transcript_83933/m.147711 type:complete len:91 (-) Transcript_83933:923-1195(-)